MSIHEFAEYRTQDGRRHDSVSFDHHPTKQETATRGNEMSVLKSDADRARAQYESLSQHYRAIGPAAILAAVLAVKKKTTLSTQTKPA
jgi:hypothetical protein